MTPVLVLTRSHKKPTCLSPIFDDELKRAFYEMECIHGNWLVRELKRQIDSKDGERPFGTPPLFFILKAGSGSTPR